MKSKPNARSVLEIRNRNGRPITPDLSKRERAMLARIASADQERGCRASNIQFTKLLKIGERQVRRDLASLREWNLITVQIESGNQRSIRLKGRPPVSRSGRRV